MTTGGVVVAFAAALALLAAERADAAGLACEDAGLRVEWVEVSAAGVTALALRNVGVRPLTLDGVDIVVAAEGEESLVTLVREGRPLIHHLGVPLGTTLAVGQTATLALSGGWRYRQLAGEWPTFEVPVRGGDPEVPDLAVRNRSRHGAVAGRVGVVCRRRDRAVDEMTFAGRRGRLEAPSWEAATQNASPAGSGDVEVVEEDGKGTAPPHAPPTLPDAEASSSGWSFSSSAQAGVFVRALPSDDDPATNDVSSGPMARLELDGGAYGWDVRANLYALADLQPGAERGVLTFQEASVGREGGVAWAKVGMQTVEWTVMTIMQPTDTVNPRFFDSSITTPIRLGQPTVAAGAGNDTAAVELIGLPVRVASVFPSSTSRRSFAPGVPVGTPLWVGEQGRVSEQRLALQGGARARVALGPVEVTAHALRHADPTQPLFFFDPEELAARPLYLPATQLGGSARWRLGGLEVRAEGANKRFSRPAARGPWGDAPSFDHTAAGAGASLAVEDRGWVHVVLAESQFWFGADPERFASITPFQRDVAVGYRVAPPGDAERSALLGAIVDVESPQRMVFLATYAQRLVDRVYLEGEALLVLADANGVVEPVQLELMDRAPQIDLLLSWRP